MKPAGFWVRLIADCIDSIILDLAACLLCLVGLGAYYWLSRMGGAGDPPEPFWSSFSSLWVQAIFTGLRAGFALPYYTLMTARLGATVGKRIFHIVVLDEASGRPVGVRQAFIRTVSYVFSYLPFGAGFFMVAFHPKKKALHDLIAGTISVIRPQHVQ